MKYSSSTLKKEIINYISSNPNCVRNLFPKEFQHTIDEEQLKNERVWKRNFKETYKGIITRSFIPSSLKLTENNIDIIEQVTVIIETDVTDTKIISISVEG